MAVYRVQGPDGTVYRVQGPDDANEEDLIEAVRKQLAQQKDEPEARESDDEPRTKVVDRDRVVDPETESEGAVQEFAEGLGSGVTKAVQGVAEIGGIAIDAVFDTNSTRAISEFGDDFRRNVGLDPVGFAGTAGDVLGQFVLPGGLAAKAVSTGLKVPRLIPGFGGAVVAKPTKLGRLNQVVRKGRGATLRSRTDRLGRPRLTRADEAKLRGQQAGAALLVDSVVATDGMTTIGDFVGGGPTLTQEDIGLSGRMEAGRRAYNKLMIGGEAGALTMAFPYLLSTTALVGGPLMDATNRYLVGPAAVTTKDALVKMANSIGNSELGQYVAEAQAPVRLLSFGRANPETTVADAYEGVKARLRFRGNLSQEAAEERSKIQGFIESNANLAASTIRKLEKDVDKVFKDAERVQLGGDTDLTKIEVFNSIYGFLTRSDGFLEQAARLSVQEGRAFDPNNVDDLLRALPEFTHAGALSMRKHIDDMSEQILASDFAKRVKDEGQLLNVNQEILDEIKGNMGKYLRRKYRIFDDPEEYLKSAEYGRNRRDVFQWLTANPEAARRLYNELPERAERLDVLADDAPITTIVKNEIIDGFVNKYRTGRGTRSRDPKALADKAAQRFSRNIFKPRKEDEALLRLLGEIEDPAEAYIRSVGDLAETLAVDRFNKFLRANRGRVETLEDGSKARVGGEDIIDGEAYMALPREFRNANYTELLDPGFGSLMSRAAEDTNAQLKDRIFARNPVFNDLTRANKQRHNYIDYAVRGFLLGKGFAQKVKTVYSPITQIRNVTSAALFAAAQGNVGRGANVWESVNLVLDNIMKTAPDERAAFFRELQELGVVGTQSQLRELERLIEDGIKRGGTGDIDELGVSLAQKRARSLGRQWFDSFDKRARDLYQGGDDIWKIYNFDFERSKIINMFSGDVTAADDYAKSLGFKSLNEYSADIVKNTVPNYERVPQFIQDLRKMPIGNFIAFPAEIIRTSLNTIQRGIDEFQRGKQMQEEAASELRTLTSRREANMMNPGDAVQKAQQKMLAGERMSDIGGRRIMGFAATAGLAGEAVQETSMMITGVTEEMIEALREVVPPWSQNSTLIPTSVDDKGRITGYIDYSYINPYDYLRRPVEGLLNAMQDGKALDQDASTIIGNMAGQVLGEMLSPFAEESIITERLLDLTVRGGEMKTGARIYKSEDTYAEKGGKAITHVLEAFTPGIIEQYLGSPAKVSPLTGDVEFAVPSRLLDAFLAEEGLDTRGNRRQIGEEILRLITGVGEVRVNAERSMLYRVLEHNKAARQPQQNFNRQLRAFTGTIRSPDEMMQIITQNYTQENERKFKIHNRAYRMIQNMKKLGMSDQEIRKAGKKLGFSNFDTISQGRFEPLNVDDKIFLEIQRFQDTTGRFFERRPIVTELNRLAKEYRSRRLTGALEEGEQPLGTRPRTPVQLPAPSASTDTPPQTSVAPIPPPAATDTGAAVDLPSAAPVQPQAAPNYNTAIDTILDPRTRELFERLGRVQ